jgi:hypothetical protein
MYESGASVSQCAASCDADETCVAFDYGPTGLCYAYKMDTLADYVGSGVEGWSCYHKIAIHEDCDTSFVFEVVALFNSYQSL